jgi:hypothetical protein
MFVVDPLIIISYKFQLVDITLKFNALPEYNDPCVDVKLYKNVNGLQENGHSFRLLVCCAIKNIVI